MEWIKTLRNGGVLNMWDAKNRLFVKIQLNRKENFICWERYVAKQRGKWVNWNKYLSLKDVAKIKRDIARGGYIERLKKVSPGQPDRWYEWQADQQPKLKAVC